VYAGRTSVPSCVAGAWCIADEAHVVEHGVGNAEPFAATRVRRLG
jgi:hypothetical protein